MEIKSYSIWEALHMPTGTRVVLASECGRQLDALKCALLSERARLTSGSREMHEFDERCQVFGLAPWTWKPYVLAQQAEGGADGTHE